MGLESDYVEFRKPQGMSPEWEHVLMVGNDEIPMIWAQGRMGKVAGADFKTGTTRIKSEAQRNRN
eukprot:5761765-Karenia_brevis.AAC.1